MSNLLKMSPAEFCAATRACTDGREFALQHATMADAWDACPKPEWLLWITKKLDPLPEDRTLRLFAVWCARSTPLGNGRVTGDLLTDPRSLAALEVAERYALGRATEEELRTARSAAYAYAADAYAYAADADAAYAAYAAAYAAYADDAAADAAAYAADAAASAADDAAADADDAAADARRAQADQFRLMVPNPFRVGEGQK